MVRQNCMIKCQKINETSDKVIKFIKEPMENWKVELVAGGKTKATEKIKRCIYKDDSLPALSLFLYLFIYLFLSAIRYNNDAINSQEKHGGNPFTK